MKESEIIVGGQAVIEGVMMRTPHAYSVAVRRPDGQIVSKGERLSSFIERYPLLKMPVLRGAVLLIHSMILGIKALNFSASVAFDELESESRATDSKNAAKNAPQALAVGAGGHLSRPLSPVEAPVETAADSIVERASGKSTTAAAAGSLAFALFFNVLLFIVLPLLLTNALFVWLDGGAIQAQAAEGAWYLQAWSWLRASLDPVRPSVAFNLVDGLIRMIFFLIMIVAFTFQRDIRRVFEYHGAEHKVVYTWEAGEDLTVENARKKQRQHPRCGTSFLMIVMLVSVITFSIVKFDSLLFNLLVRVVLVPVVAGISYEVIRASARSRAQWFFSIITRPGLWLQNLTTREPDDSQLEVAIFALKESLKLEPRAQAAKAA